MYADKNYVVNNSKKENEREDRLTMRKLREITEAKVDPAVSSLLVDLGCVIRIEFGVSDNVNIGVFDKQSGKKMSTLVDLVKMTSIRGMLIRSLESRQKGSKKSIAELTLAAKEKEQVRKLAPEMTKRIINLNPWITGLNLLNKTLKVVMGSVFPTDRFTVAFLALADSYGDVLSSMFDDIRSVDVQSNASDELYRLMMERGIPQWFHKNVILKMNDFKARINLENPYKLFFSARGVGGITLLTEELLDKTFIGKFVGLVGTIYDGSRLLESIVDRIEKEDANFKAGGFIPADNNERTNFKSFKWALGLCLDKEDVKGFFDAKGRNQTCPMMPFYSTTYVDKLTRVNIALIRASHMEGTDAETTVNLFCDVFQNGRKTILETKQTNVFEIAKGIEGFDESFSAYTNMRTEDMAKNYLGMVGRLMSTDIFTVKRGSLNAALNVDPSLELKEESFDEFAEKLCELIDPNVVTMEIYDDMNPGVWLIDNVENITKLLKERLVPEVADEVNEVRFASYSLRNKVYQNSVKPSSGLANFLKDGKYYLPIDDEEAMKEIESNAESFKVDTTEETETPHVGSHTIHDEVVDKLNDFGIKRKLTGKLLLAVCKLMKCFKHMKMQDYIADAVIATYQDFEAGNINSTANDEEDLRY